MKYIYLSFTTPTAWNVGAPSALPYHLLKYRPEGVEVKLYTFNLNRVPAELIKEVSKGLHVEIKVIPMPRWYGWMFRLHLSVLRVLLKYPVLRYVRVPSATLKEIREQKPDGVWIYNEELAHYADCFGDVPCVVTTPDSIPLYYYRVLGKHGCFNSAWKLLKYGMMYLKFSKLEEEFPNGDGMKYRQNTNAFKGHIIYHLVGEEDVRFLKNINEGINAVFLPHPHYDYCPDKVINFSLPKIRIIMTGRYDFAMQSACDMAVDAFVHNTDLSAHYVFTLLGKDWTLCVSRLRQSGYEVSEIKFAENYEEELAKHDILLAPISVGAGTKGKVLDGFVNGLLVIGTPCALENIHSNCSGTQKSCVEFSSEEELAEVLRDIHVHVQKYEAMAEAGRKAVLEAHGRERVARELFGLYKGLKV